VDFPPSESPRGVDEHPHRGFETVTIVYQGELEHRDSAGNAGSIGPGDVQWMTAASGVVHEEKHGREFSRRGGPFEVVQLWVNLPARDKAASPGYQTLLRDSIPVVSLGDSGVVRVIAGEFNGVKGPARTFTPVNVWDARLEAGQRAELDLPAGHAGILVVLRGAVALSGSRRVGATEMALLDRAGAGVTVAAEADATLLVLSGEPIDEPIAGYGPFVMNTEAEIRQAVEDYRRGAIGR
jgi:quercetin 2,3-dioxygenase